MKDLLSPRCASRWTLPLLLAVILLTAGCDDESLMPPTAIDPLFDRYVALGNSITAGYQSDGMNRLTQQQAYPVLVARQMGIAASFNIPALALPGCPPPLVQLVPVPDRLGPPAVACAGRVADPLPPYISNVAVPGAEVIDLLTNLAPSANANALTTILLGGRTQLEAAADAQPTFVSVWIGNNDVLAAALVGTTALITPGEQFRARYATVLDSLQAIGVQGGLLIGVANPTLIPYLSPGAAYWQAERLGALPPTYEVADNCAPPQFGGVGFAVQVPFRYGIQGLLSLARAGQSVTLDCEDNRPLRERVDLPDALESLAPYSILTGPEIQTIVAAVQSFNAFIADRAEALGWAYLDPNIRFSSERFQAQVPAFPQLRSQQPFGPLFSLDGVHPSGAAHVLIANAVIEAINADYGTSIPLVSDSG